MRPISSPVVPPLSFAKVSDGIYRSGYPIKESLAFILEMKFKSFVCLSPTEIPVINKEEMELVTSQMGITIINCDVKVNQEPFLAMDEDEVQNAVQFALQADHHPVLVYCLNGRLKTSCVIGCLRKCQGWSFAAIMEEFEAYSHGEGGLADLAFIERFQAKK